jgi:hypothetical protein
MAINQIKSNHLTHCSDTGAPIPMKQSAPPPIQERPAPVRGRFLDFIEQRTRIDPSLRLGRAAKMYSHERPSFHIRTSFISSSLHETLLSFGFSSAWCILECVATSWLMSNAAELIIKCECSEIDGSLNSRLYVTLSPILVYLRKP